MSRVKVAPLGGCMGGFEVKLSCGFFVLHAIVITWRANKSLGYWKNILDYFCNCRFDHRSLLSMSIKKRTLYGRASEHMCMNADHGWSFCTRSY